MEEPLATFGLDICSTFSVCQQGLFIADEKQICQNSDEGAATLKVFKCRFYFVHIAVMALYLWNNDHIESLIRQNRKVILPIIFPALERSGRAHWNQVVQTFTLNVRKIFSNADPELFEECLDKFPEDEAKLEEEKTNHEATWKILEEIAASKVASN